MSNRDRIKLSSEHGRMITHGFYCATWSFIYVEPSRVKHTDLWTYIVHWYSPVDKHRLCHNLQMKLFYNTFYCSIFLQRRTRERLMNVLSLCGPESGVPKNPSVRLLSYSKASDKVSGYSLLRVSLLSMSVLFVVLSVLIEFCLNCGLWLFLIDIQQLYFTLRL